MQIHVTEGIPSIVSDHGILVQYNPRVIRVDHLDFSVIGEVLFYYGCIQTILFGSGIFYGHVAGRAAFAERYSS